MRLEGRVALVTGGGRGIGRATAIALAEEGASVAVIARTTHEIEEVADLIKDRGGKALASTADVTEKTQVDTAVQQTSDQLGPIDILVNNAGGGRAIGPVWEVDPDEWWASVEINLRSVFNCCHVILPSMIKRGRGRIINVSSGLALNPLPHGSSYSASKAAVLRFTDSLALEVEPHGVQVFAMSPGTVRTAMTDYILESGPGRRWLPQMRQMPESVWVPAERGAGLITALAAGEADALSGRFIHVSDDLEDLVRRADEIRAADTLTLRLRR